MKTISWLIAMLLTLLLISIVTAYLWLSASMADYDGHYQGAVANPVYLERDQLGYLTVQAQDRSDAA